MLLLVVCFVLRISLYKDDGLVDFKIKNGSQSEKIKKVIQAITHKYNLKVAIKRNLKVADYLYVTLNLQPFKRQSHKMVKHTQTIRQQFAGELFECV